MKEIKRTSKVEFDVLYADGTKVHVEEGCLFSFKDKEIISHLGLSKASQLFAIPEAVFEVFHALGLLEEYTKYIEKIEPEKYNLLVGKWIPVIERLPSQEEIARTLGSREFNVMIEDAVAPTTLEFDEEGNWRDDMGNYYPVVAWANLPESYQAPCEIKKYTEDCKDCGFCEKKME